MISILMAVFNGEAFLAEQLESLLLQTEKNIRVIISDDASTDGSFEILKQYEAKYPGIIEVSRNAANSGSSQENFYRLMSSCKDEYVMLCDQDDVWLPDKIAITLKKMREMEALHGKHLPILVHTDLRVVDKDLNIINESYKKAMNANYDRIKLNDLLIQNTVTGCTAMYNKALANLICGEPPFMVQHDWWAGLIASAFGRIGHIDEQTILYRQHGRNVFGAKDVRTFGYKLNRLVNGAQVKEAINGTYKQAESFLEMFKKDLNEEQLKLVGDYISIPGKSKLRKWETVFRLGAFKSGIARNVAYLMFI